MALLVACEAFITAEDIETHCGCKVDQLNDQLGLDAITEVIDAASDMIATASGGVETGRCTSTVRPCSDGVCGCYMACSCRDIDGVRLDFIGVEIVSVKVDGATLGPELYKLIDGNMLVRVGGVWPGYQNLTKASTEPGTFEITFTYGLLSWVAKQAAIEMACDLIQASLPDGKPKLPPGTIAALMDGTSVQLSPQQLTGFPWMARLQGLYPPGNTAIVWSPEVGGRYTLHTVS